MLYLMGARDILPCKIPFQKLPGPAHGSVMSLIEALSKMGVVQVGASSVHEVSCPHCQSGNSV